MKKIYFSITFWVAFLTMGHAQLTFHVMGGVSPQSTPSAAGLIINRESPHDEFVLNLNEVGPQYFGGVNARLEMMTPFFMQMGINYTKKNSTYKLNYTLIDTEHPVSLHQMKETEHLLSMPISIGVHLGNFDVTSGLKLIYSVAGQTDLSALPGFSKENKPLRLGWQGGFGYEFFGTRLGIEFNSEFSRVGRGMSVNGQSLELMNVPGQFVFTIQKSL